MALLSAIPSKVLACVFSMHAHTAPCLDWAVVYYHTDLTSLLDFNQKTKDTANEGDLKSQIGQSLQICIK